jgi:hypothetical protein
MLPADVAHVGAGGLASLDDVPAPVRAVDATPPLAGGSAAALVS